MIEEGERGDGPVGLLVAASVFVIGSTLLVHAALGHFAQRVMAGAAQEGAVTAAMLNGGVDDGIAVTDQLIAEAGRSLFTTWNTTAEVQRDAAGRRTVLVAVQAEVIGPLGPWSAEAAASAPIEEFLAQRPGDGTPLSEVRR